MAGAQVACIPPEEPYPFEPGDLEPELRQIVNDQYEGYVRKIEDHINCLEAERAEAMRSAQEVVQRWVRYFGNEAALRYDVELNHMPADHRATEPSGPWSPGGLRSAEIGRTLGT